MGANPAGCHLHTAPEMGICNQYVRTAFLHTVFHDSLETGLSMQVLISARLHLASMSDSLTNQLSEVDAPEPHSSAKSFRSSLLHLEMLSNRGKIFIYMPSIGRAPSRRCVASIDTKPSGQVPLQWGIQKLKHTRTSKLN